MTLKLFAVALSFGTSPVGRLIVGNWFSETPEQATACVTASVLQEYSFKEVLYGVGCHEISPERIDQFLQQKREYDEALKKAPQVVQLVPPPSTQGPSSSISQDLQKMPFVPDAGTQCPASWPRPFDPDLAP